ncbi:alkaline exonuclease protein [Alphabaculovirus altersperidaniae]|uniref:Alkaline exonuclease protein n=1 Tax=Spodoptera eridania nucleopolyhedrovirus TaxID=2315721 RepID=A0ABX6TR39_9ABAC|nr:alkaline exonuclease protein [Spodoptera eridania nucleopolyhedrovirus]QNV47865.1 alkaline exonuclease protein [Spodoptera eridania nucleopolyhedrovirus]
MTNQRDLTDAELRIFNKYSYNNYVKSLQSTSFRLSREDIKTVERFTRKQSANPLWNLLRLDRQTASGTNNTSSTSISQSAAMCYGLVEEKRLKSDKFLVDQIRNVIECTLGGTVVETVLECGMFLSEFGLFSASPDAYFLVKNVAADNDNNGGTMYVPIEIKCPHTYRNQNFIEVRNSLGIRNDRYRVKHTALSVNKMGDAMFAVEQTDPHYRQMQRQMYVMNSPMCVYVVKFDNSYVVLPVLRNQTFYLKEYQSEKMLFERFVQKNRTLLVYNTEYNRAKSLSSYYSDRDTVKRLARNGIFCDFGRLKCINCDADFDLDAPIDVILSKNRYCGDSGIEQMSKIFNKDYISHKHRVESLLDHNKNAKLADDGVYYDGEALRTFCCGVMIVCGEKKINHNVSCKYNLMVQQQQH